VSLGGVTVSRATLHNREEIARKDLRVDDEVRVVRAGDVIPEITARVSRGRRRRGPRFRMPPRCPSCGSRVVRDGPFDRCPEGLTCPAQLRRAIAHFGSRHALDIRGLGAHTVDALVESGLVRSVADVLALDADDLERLPRFGPGAARNLARAIARARQTTLARFLYALGIPGVGTRTARSLADAFGTLPALTGADARRIRAEAGVGPIVARAVADFFRRPANRRVVRACLRHGLRLRASRPAGRGPLAGTRIVFTGSLATMTRADAEERARQLGARPASTVSAATDLVVAGSRAGSKLARARALGIDTITERQFLRY